MADKVIDAVVYMGQDGVMHIGLASEATGPSIPMKVTIPGNSTEATAFVAAQPRVDDADIMRALANHLGQSIAPTDMGWQKVPGGYARLFKLGAVNTGA